MYRSNWLIFAILFEICTLNLMAQEAPIQWEEISLSDLQMSTYPPDTNATAVILCDYGESRIDDDLRLEFTTHQRIKILNEKGYEWGTKSIYIYDAGGSERLDDLEAITYSLDDNGKIVATELDDDDIFEENVTETRLKVTFTMPALKPGCIIDIRYKIISESISQIKSWYFQDSEPVLWSEYRLTYPKQISYAIVKLGYEPWFIDEYNEVTQVYTGTASAYFGKMANCNYYRWAVKNAPAMREEAYITTIKDYINRIDIQLSGYTFGPGVKKVLTDWKTLSDELIDNTYFGERIEPSEVEDLTNSLTKDLTTPEEKMNKIYNWIAKSIVWNNQYSVYANYDVEDVLEYKKGSSAEITFLLISMLQSAGINSEPIILSTRAHGAIQEIYPIVSQFNYVIARVIIGTDVYYLDATDPLRPISILPTYILNVRGLAIRENSPQWVHFSAKEANENKTVINVNLNPDGTLKVNFDDKFGDYSSLTIREDGRDKNDLDIVEQTYEFASQGFTIDSSSIINKDSINYPVKIHAGISSSDYAQVSGDMIYLNPFVLHRLKENPFKVAQRKFPIDYSYPRAETILINVYLPEGYELKEQYANKTLSAGSVANYKRQVQVQDNIVQILSKREIKESVINSKYYNQLKYFYSEVISAESEMLVIGPKQTELGSQ